MRILLLFVIAMTTAEASEIAWLREVDGDHGKRGLPSSEKEFELRRSSGKVKLKLKENKRLNQFAPLYKVVRDSDGKNRLVRKTDITKMEATFYQSEEYHGAFKMTYDSKRQRSILSGSFVSDNEVLKLVPAPDVMPSPEQSNNSDDSAYILEPEPAYEAKGKNAYTMMVEDYKRIPDAEVEEELKSYPSQKTIEQELKKLKSKRSRRKRETNNVNAVEVFVTADEKVWEKFYSQTSEGGGLTREQATELRLREHYVHIVNAVSMRYQSIKDPQMNIYLTITGFLFLQTRDDTRHPLPESANIIELDGEYLVDGDYYLVSLVPWAWNLYGLPHNDHIAVFTDYDLYSGSTSEEGRLLGGKAYLNSICGTHRSSIIEDGDWFSTVSLFAHELGHSLGARHDGETETSECPSEDKYIMSPEVTLFRKDDKYTPNPWTFSSCSIKAFKAMVEALREDNCLLDTGDIYDTSEHQTHLELLPGQLRTADQQCKWAWTENSFLCTFITSQTDASFCRRMSCYHDGYCYTQMPAIGTHCGEADANTYCINGECVEKSAEHWTGTVCKDTGLPGYTCSQIDNYYRYNYDYGTTQWCQNKEMETVCCAYCQAACIDVGWADSTGAHWTCDQISDYYLHYEQKTPAYWCSIGWKPACCAYCAVNGV